MRSTDCFDSVHDSNDLCCLRRQLIGPAEGGKLFRKVFRLEEKFEKRYGNESGESSLRFIAHSGSVPNDEHKLTAFNALINYVLHFHSLQSAERGMWRSDASNVRPLPPWESSVAKRPFVRR